MARTLRPAALAVALLLAFAGPAAAQRTDFARLSARLSEGNGFFDSDNLVSNETSYLHIMGALRQLGVHGGVYLGVGPEQSFSYIAEIEPELAILIDIRRDNLLLHLLMKAMFEQARNRLEYLCLLYGRAAPRRSSDWEQRDLAAVLAQVDSSPADSALHGRQHRELMRRVEGYGLVLSDSDRVTLRRFHDEFAGAGLDIHFTSGNRMSRRAYPTARRLYLETDLEGNQASFLATERRWRTVREMQRRNRIIPVVGDLAGAKAMPAIAAYLRETGRTVSVFYVSNVEQYLFQYGTFPAFARNVEQLPAGPGSVLIRSWFFRGPAPISSDHFSSQQLQSFEAFRNLAAMPDGLNYWMLQNDWTPPVPVPRP